MATISKTNRTVISRKASLNLNAPEFTRIERQRKMDWEEERAYRAQKRAQKSESRGRRLLRHQ